MNDEAYAQTLADQIVDWYAEPLERVELETHAIPWIKLGDMIAVSNETSWQSLMRVTAMKMQIDLASGLSQKIEARSISNFETLDFFTIGTSEIGGTDVIGT
jgi:hypothetical protein